MVLVDQVWDTATQWCFTSQKGEREVDEHHVMCTCKPISWRTEMHTNVQRRRRQSTMIFPAADAGRLVVMVTHQWCRQAIRWSEVRNIVTHHSTLVCCCIISSILICTYAPPHQPRHSLPPTEGGGKIKLTLVDGLTPACSTDGVMHTWQIRLNN